MFNPNTKENEKQMLAVQSLHPAAAWKRKASRYAATCIINSYGGAFFAQFYCQATGICRCIYRAHDSLHLCFFYSDAFCAPELRLFADCCLCLDVRPSAGRYHGNGSRYSRDSIILPRAVFPRLHPQQFPDWHDLWIFPASKTAEFHADLYSFPDDFPDCRPWPEYTLAYDSIS